MDWEEKWSATIEEGGARRGQLMKLRMSAFAFNRTLLEPWSNLTRVLTWGAWFLGSSECLSGTSLKCLTLTCWETLGPCSNAFWKQWWYYLFFINKTFHGTMKSRKKKIIWCVWFDSVSSFSLIEKLLYIDLLHWWKKSKTYLLSALHEFAWPLLMLIATKHFLNI